MDVSGVDCSLGILLFDMSLQNKDISGIKSDRKSFHPSAKHVADPTCRWGQIQRHQVPQHSLYPAASFLPSAVALGTAELTSARREGVPVWIGSRFHPR